MSCVCNGVYSIRHAARQPLFVAHRVNTVGRQQQTPIDAYIISELKVENKTHPSIIQSQSRERNGILVLLILGKFIHLDLCV